MPVLNYKILSRTIGSLLFVETGMFLLCLTIAAVYKESDVTAFAFSALLAFFIGFILKWVGHDSGKTLNRRDAFFVVAVTWIVFSIIGMLPFMITGVCPNISDAFFETMSGFTTTGSTVICNVEPLPHGILFWRSLTHWVGGLGIVIFTMALLPGAGESSIRLFSAEATGPTREKLHPRIRTTVKWLFSLYFLLTLACSLSLWGCGMNAFDSINHAMSTISTGGFSTHNAGIMFYRSPAIEYVEIIFMFLSGINFFLLYLIIQKKNIKLLLRDNEFRFYSSCILITTTVATAALAFYNGHSIEHSLRSALFNVVSVQTTTGFVSENTALWWHPVWFFLFFVMITGGCAGSTSGGIKCIRLLTLGKTATNHFRHLLHPNAYMPVRVNHAIVPEAVEQSLLAFLSMYGVLLVAGTLCFSSMGISFFDSINIVICCISNVGATDGLSHTPVSALFSLPDIGKWLCSFLMLAGRLEIFPLLMPLVPAFWKNN